MRNKTFTSILIFILSIFAATAQSLPHKQLAARRSTGPVHLDGLINEKAWGEASKAAGFIEFRPKAGRPEDSTSRTDAYIMYTDEGIYFGGFCFEPSKDSISAELTGRDGFGNNDMIGVVFDTYYDKLNAFEFFVTPLGEQWDGKVAPNNNGNDEDFNWNAVWFSKAVIHNNGWSFEIFLPFSAIRFGKKDVQTWGLNITRRRQKAGRQFMWNPVDPNINGWLTQEGTWSGIANIKPPLRLQFSPYFSAYANHYPLNQPGKKNVSSQINGGMDVKYGINQAFTLDATLIPDFGQVQSDNAVLNLGPFDIRFNENRSFFTEGTELFGKGGLFYSRRIGVEPVFQNDPYSNLQPGEGVIKDPQEAKLLNATKISGRTQRGLGIGVLNAITRPRKATIENSSTKEQYKVETEPLTNYNILVLDQTLKYNSGISLVNTNVWRKGSAYDANVTAALFTLNNKKNMWQTGGQVAVSNQWNVPGKDKTETGYSHELYFGKTSGRFNFTFWQELTDTRYSHRDMGYFTNNNFLTHGVWAGYNWTEPKKFYNRIAINLNSNVSRLLKPVGVQNPMYQFANINIHTQVQSKRLWAMGVQTNFIFPTNDYYEPRKDGWFFRKGASLVLGGWFESNRAKKYHFSAEAKVRPYFHFYNSLMLDLGLGQNYRFSSRFSLRHEIMFNPHFNNIGYSYVENSNDVNFARRKRNTVENTLFAKYSFNNKMGLTFRARHYFSSVKNKEFYFLKTDGSLQANPQFISGADQNFNLFNIDMLYTWEFAPGSFLNIAWKDAALLSTDEVRKGYFQNLGDVLESGQNNNLSVKLIYFLDYLTLKSKWKKKDRNS